ncbi:MAG TPA: hypothetical protein PKM88_05615 [bacterium]|mgnify:CR=1 FL=1|nr:hypothetical protein [bacterium]
MTNAVKCVTMALGISGIYAMSLVCGEGLQFILYLFTTTLIHGIVYIIFTNVREELSVSLIVAGIIMGMIVNILAFIVVSVFLIFFGILLVEAHSVAFTEYFAGVWIILLFHHLRKCRFVRQISNKDELMLD